METNFDQNPAEKKSLMRLLFLPLEPKAGDSWRETSAIVSVVFGGISLVAWVVMLFGVLFSTLGLVFSIVGLRSNHIDHARVGFILSIIGFIAVFLFAYAASHGMINLSYFTTEILN